MTALSAVDHLDGIRVLIAEDELRLANAIARRAAQPPVLRGAPRTIRLRLTALSGPADELRGLADTLDSMLARLDGACASLSAAR